MPRRALAKQFQRILTPLGCLQSSRASNNQPSTCLGKQQERSKASKIADQPFAAKGQCNNTWLIDSSLLKQRLHTEGERAQFLHFLFFFWRMSRVFKPPSLSHSKIWSSLNHYGGPIFHVFALFFKFVFRHSNYVGHFNGQLLWHRTSFLWRVAI